MGLGNLASYGRFPSELVTAGMCVFIALGTLLFTVAMTKILRLRGAGSGSAVGLAMVNGILAFLLLGLLVLAILNPPVR